MTIRQLSLNDFRNLKSTTLDLHERLNIITGSNASGKTSFLEALHIICQGRSFKTNSINHCIHRNRKSFLLFAKFDKYQAGISRTKTNTSIRIDNQTINKFSHLAKKSPIKIINNTTLDLILGNPGTKRQFIDWSLFHVEHNYLDLWLSHKHALKQRNALLKKKSLSNELDYWDSHLAEISQLILNSRSNGIKLIQDIFTNEFKELHVGKPIQLTYKPGWDTSNNLIDVLKDNRKIDFKYGYTSFGCHRDDIKIKRNNIDIKNIFSRGEIKNISLFLTISQIILLNRSTHKEVIVLIDDLYSELDKKSVEYILEKLSSYDIQVFITSIESIPLVKKYYQEYKLFHVEHGMIKSVKNI